TIAALPQRLDLLRDEGRRIAARRMRARDPYRVCERMASGVEAASRVDHHGVEGLQQIDGRLRTVEERDVGRSAACRTGYRAVARRCLAERNGILNVGSLRMRLCLRAAFGYGAHAEHDDRER